MVTVFIMREAGTFRLLKWPGMTNDFIAKKMIVAAFLYFFFRYTNWLYRFTKGEIFSSCFDETKTQDTDNSTKINIPKKKMQNYQIN